MGYHYAKWGRVIDAKRSAKNARKRTWDDESSDLLPNEKLFKKGEVVTEVHVRVYDSTYKSNHLIMSWYTQVCKWIEEGNDVKLVVHIPARKKSVKQLFEASFRPLPHIETSLVW